MNRDGELQHTHYAHPLSYVLFYYGFICSRSDKAGVFLTFVFPLVT